MAILDSSKIAIKNLFISFVLPLKKVASCGLSLLLWYTKEVLLLLP